MQSLLNEIVISNVFAFLLIFMRFGTALMLMPGIGDSFVTPKIRLLFALGLSFVLTPVLSSSLPPMPVQTADLLMLLISEALVGIFIGTVMRIMISALDTAGSVVSIQAGLSNAMVFNPMTATQGSVGGALYSTLGVTLLLVMNMHYYLIASVVESYHTFPAVAALPDTGSMMQAIRLAVSAAFKIGVEMALPFIIIGILIQIGFGLLGRLMPQVQIFFLALPLQIGISLIIMAMTLSVCMMYWANGYIGYVTRFIGF